MPYCSKCGVEVEDRVTKCPLCTFPIPDVGQNVEGAEHVFPENTINLYPQKIKEMRNIIYFAISIVIFSLIMVMYTVTDFFGLSIEIFDYSIVILLGAWGMCYFLFGFLRSFLFNASGCILAGIVGTYFLDRVDGAMTWFYDLALPLLVALLVIIAIQYYFFKRNRHKVEFYTLSLYICIALALLFVSAQVIITHFLTGTYMFSWSLIMVAIALVLFLVLLGLRYKLPESVKERLRRIFHI